MTSHTPGPWENEDDRKDGQDLPWRSTGLIWARNRGEFHPGTKICQINCDKLHSESPAEEIKTFEANAKLIAAAPEMYRNIEVAIQYLTDSGYEKADPSEPEYQMLQGFKEIIKKAKGEL